MFKDYVEDNLVKKITPDKQLARSLVRIAKIRIKNIEEIALTDESSLLFIENCYEAIRELTDALMAIKGFKSYSHEASIEFLKEFYSIQITSSRVNKIDRYRILRNDIKYRGLITSKNEAEEVLKNTKIIIKILLEILEQEGVK